MNLIIQIYLLAHMLVYGAFVGITFDLVSVVKDDIRLPFQRIAAMIAYWLFLVPVSYVYLYQVNDGIFHLAIFPFLFAGIFLYFKCMRSLFWRDLETFGKVVFLILGFLKKLMNMLVISPFLFLYKLISAIIKKILIILGAIFVQPFRKMGKRFWDKKKVKKHVKRAKKAEAKQRRQAKKANSNRDKEGDQEA